LANDVSTMDRARIAARAHRAARGWRWSASLCFLMLCAAAPTLAQVLPAEPVTLGGGAVTIGGEASVTVGSDDPGYFNYSSYAYNLLRLARVDGTAELRLGSHVSLLGDLRVQADLEYGDTQVNAHSAFVRIRPWLTRAFDIQAGLVPPVFGAFSRRGYRSDYPLIGFPLGYQYLTSLRPDAIPASADDLLRMRGRGWLVRYPIGDTEAYHGVPLMDGLQYQTGVEVHAAAARFDLAAAVTNGSAADPEIRDGSARLTCSGRVAYRPVPGGVLGVSAARGAFLDEGALDAAEAGGAARDGAQTALGVDAEYSYGHWILRGELITSWWQMPRVAEPFIDSPLRSVAAYVEARYRMRPGLTAALRVDRLDFSGVSGSGGRRSWDAPVTRVEGGAGYAIIRNVVVKAAYQYNWRDSSRYPRLGLASAQLLFWF
jgi:hypothetical protein